jgi:hypothetical protein
VTYQISDIVDLLHADWQANIAKKIADAQKYATF